MPEPDSTDSLLAQWAELLRVRDQVRTSQMISYVVRYGDKEFEIDPDDWDRYQQFYILFVEHISERIARLEKALSEQGIEVRRNAASPTVEGDQVT